MSDIDKTKEKLSEELKQARQKIAELELGIIDRGKTPPLDYSTFKAFFESASDSFSIWDSNMKMVYLNDATLTKYYPPGTKRADVIGKHFTELVPGSVESGRYDKYLNVLNSGAPVYIEEFTPHNRFGNMHLAIRVFKIDNGLGVITIDITERKRMEQAIQDSQQRLSALIENAPDVIFTYDTSGRFVSGNKRAEELMGYSREEMLGKTFTESGIFTPESLARASERLAENMIGKQTQPISFELIAKDGSRIFVEVHSVPIIQGDKVEVIAIARDITERKRTEEALRQSEEKLRLMFSSISDAITVVDLSARTVDLNDAAVRIFECNSKNEVLGMNSLDFIAGKDQERAIGEFENTLKTMRGELREYKLLTRGGREFDGEITTNVLKDESGNSAGFICIIRDITERKRLEEQLRQSEEKFRVIFNSIADGISVIDLTTGKLIDTNEAALRMFNFTREDVIGTYSFELIAEKDRPSAMEDFARTLEKGYSGLNEWCLLGKGGTEHDCEATSAVICDKYGKAIYLVNVMRDISERKRIEKELKEYRDNLETMVKERTADFDESNKGLKLEIAERKRMEEALRESEEKYRGIFDESIATVYVFDTKKNFINTNQAGLDLLGYSREELLRMSIPDVDADPVVVLTAHKELLSGGRLINYEHKLRRKDGTIVSVLNNSRPLTDGHGNVVGMLSTLINVTERKQMEEDLREKEALLRSFFNSPGLICGIVELEADDVRYITVNATMAEMYSLTPEDLANKLASEIGTDKGIVRLFIENYKKSRENDAPSYFEYHRVVGQGERWFYVTVTFLGFELNSHTPRYAFVTTDITERRKAEEALQESEEKFRLLAEQSLMAIGLIQDGTFKYVNKAYEIMSGYSGQELLSWKPYEYIKVIHPDDREFVGEQIKRKQAGEQDVVPHYEFRGITKGGDVLRLDLYSKTVTYAGKPADLFTFVNITERKQMEEALQESEERLRVFFENVPDILFAHNMEGQFTDINKKALELSGYSRDELVGKNILETGILPPDQLEGVAAGIKGIENGKSGYPYEVQLVKKNGERMTVEAVSFPMRRKGRLDVMGIALDITERKKTEEALRASEEKLRAIFEAIEDGIAVADLKGNLIDMNESDIRLFGYERKEQLLNVNAFRFVTEADRPRVISDMSAVLTTGSGRVDQYRLVDKEGNEFDAEVSGSLLRDSQGKPAAMVNIIRDITQRKQLEEALKESEAKYRTLVEQSEQGICILQNGRIVFTNKALSKLNGYSIKEMYAMSSEELMRLTVHPGDKEAYVKHTKMRLEGKRLRSRQEYRAIRKDGTELCFETYSKRILYKGQPAIQSTMLDITERKQWESSLQQSKSDLSFYLSQINQAQEEERKRIARELHDDTIQEIVALSRQLDNLIDKKIGPEEEKRENRRLIEDAQRKVDTILKGIRRFTRDLRPSILDDLGLVPALEWLTTDISEQFKIPIKISIRGEEQHIASDAALAMFRIAQEALRNACRHSGATHIQVDLKYTSPKVTLSITDNGQGFDLPEDTASLIRRGKLGVAGMYERAQLIGANLSIKPRRNKGTSVTLEVYIK